MKMHTQCVRFSIDKAAMFSILDQLSLASKAVFEAQLTSAAAFAQAAFDSGVGVIELNVEAAKSSVAAATVATNQLLSVKDMREWMSLAGNQSQLAMERVGAYGRQAGDLVQDSQSKFSSVAETEGAASQHRMAELVDAVKKAPAAAITPLNSFFKAACNGAADGSDPLTRAEPPMGANKPVAGDDGGQMQAPAK